MENKGRVLFRSLTTPDGTELISHNRHDYVCHTDTITKKYYMLDGGLDYCRTSNPGDGVYTTLTDADPFEIIREHFTRGSRGKNMDQELRWVKLSEMSNEHLDAVIVYCMDHRATMYLDIYLAEVKYRQKNNIFITENYNDEPEVTPDGNE